MSFSPPQVSRMGIRPIVWAVACCYGPAASLALDLRLDPLPSTSSAVQSEAEAPRPWPTPASALPSGDPATVVVLQALQLRSSLDAETVATGDVVLSQGDIELRAKTLRLLHANKMAYAQGDVALRRGLDRFAGSEAQVNLDTREGLMRNTVYDIGRTGGGGDATEVRFWGQEKVLVSQGRYTACTREGVTEPDWVLQAESLSLDFPHNEGRAKGAVLRFLGVPILPIPEVSFPVTGDRKSGWLPPDFEVDSRAGAGLAVPYYFNLAPNYDLTVSPGYSSRRGAYVHGEFRYLQPGDEGSIKAHSLPYDEVAGRSRGSAEVLHRGEGRIGPQRWRYELDAQWASDDRYWTDFSRVLSSQTPRLLSQRLATSADWASRNIDLQARAYAQVQGWQVLQDATDPVLPPYQRVPQIGLAAQGEWADWAWRSEAEFNRFELRSRPAADPRSDGSRVHWALDVRRVLDAGWGWMVPSLRSHAASYRTDQAMSDGRLEASRIIPSVSVDSGLRMERQSDWFGLPWRQTLEPRLHYVYTPVVDQAALPLFDTAARDFNELSIYADSGFAGQDRISDANQATFGLTSRLLERATGAERLRFGFAQRYQFRPQRLTPDGSTNADSLSDILLFGSGTPTPQWRIDATMQFNTDNDRFVRSVTSVRWQPEPFHTLVGTYRYARDLNEQMDVGWQWPMYRGEPRSAGGCGGTLYGVGRVNYNLRDRRTTDALLGLEWDAGCWVARVVAQRTSTNRSEATERLMIQLELVGLSRLGSNPLKVLKDNIPGYRLLRDDTSSEKP